MKASSARVRSDASQYDLELPVSYASDYIYNPIILENTNITSV